MALNALEYKHWIARELPDADRRLLDHHLIGILSAVVPDDEFRAAVETSWTYATHGAPLPAKPVLCAHGYLATEPPCEGHADGGLDTDA